MSQATDLLTAALTDRYSIVREIGSGGMATVFLAEDLRHHRKVALKVLRPELAATIGSGRFLHEIEIAAGLQHPHILPLLDSGDASGFLYYVMPFIEGPSLRDRLARQGELPVHDAVKILIEVVDALAAAHAKGIVHRDIKPENILLTGRHALVADFGVAKAVNEATGRHQLTTAGVALGTPAYMAPEQASADPNLDHRVDLYAVGAMAYEMLTGQPPFSGQSSAQVLSAHVMQVPEPVTRRRASVSPALEQVVMKCLEKLPGDRYQSAEELVGALEAVATPTGGTTPVQTQPVKAIERPAPAGSRRLLGVGALAGIGLVAIAAAVLRGGGESRVEFGPVRPVTTDPGLEMQPALSPDGRTLAYVAGPIGQFKLYVRSLSGGTPIQVAKDFEPEQQTPAWSPDGTRLLFSAEDGLYAVPGLGGTPRRVATAGFNPGWSPDGKSIAYSVGDTLLVRGVDGGEPRVLATGLDLHSPAWSPDGRLVGFVSTNSGYWVGASNLGNLAPSILMVVKAEGGEPVRLTGRKFLAMSPQWLPDSRHLLFMSTQDGGRDLYSQEIDGNGRPAGPALRLTTGLDIGTFSLSADGLHLAYCSFPNTSNVWAVPIPVAGVLSDADASQITTGTQHVEGVAVTRDGQWLAFDTDRMGNADIFVMATAGGEPRQVTTDPSYDFIPSWSADGTAIVFHSWRNESRDVYAIPASGGDEVLVAGGPAMDFYPDWSPDGRSVVFHSDRTGRHEVYVTSLREDGRWGEPRQLSQNGGSQGRWSPDGRSILYTAFGRVMLVPSEGGPSRPIVVSDATGVGALFAVWAPDSRTIYFKAADAQLRASFWAVPAAGGRPRLLVRFTNPSFANARQEFATDGKRLYFTADDRQSDLKVMEVRRAR